MASNVTRDHHNLRRNLKLNGNYISNDGGNEGISITDAGAVTIGGEQLTIDRNVTSTDAGTYTGLSIDFDKTGSTTSDNTMIGMDINTYNTGPTDGTNSLYGIKSTATLYHVTLDGTANVYGGWLSAASSTGGVSNSYGLYVTASGADTDNGVFIRCSNSGNDLKITNYVNADDYFQITTRVNGATTISTVDSDDAEAAHLTFDIQGDTIFKGDIADGTATEVARIDASASSLLMASGKKIEFGDAGEHISGDGTDLSITSSNHLTLAPDGDLIVSGADVHIDAGKSLFLDGGGNTYINEPAPDIMRFTVGADRMLQLYEDGANGNNAVFDSAVTFAYTINESFSDDTIIGSGGTDDTHIDFRFSNKIKLEVTGAITNLNLIFPPGSGNFTLLLTYTGDYTITNYKVYEFDESAADGATDVLWAGGTKPDNTASGVDILSFFYDATTGSDKCYGVASLAFAVPS